MKDYYQILGVRQRAGLPEIRRAYRILVQKLHPDVNPDPTAHELVKEVNEAYDVLSHEAKKAAYDYELANSYGVGEINVPQEPAHRDRAYKGTGRRSEYFEKSERLQLMEKSLFYIRWLAKASIIFCSVLAFDFLLPRTEMTEEIVEIREIHVYRTSRYSRSKYHDEDMIITKSDRRIVINKSLTKYFKKESSINIYKSKIFSIETLVSTGTGSYSITNLGTIFNNFLLVPIILSIASIIGIAVRKGSLDFHFSLGLVILVLLGITIKLML